MAEDYERQADAIARALKTNAVSTGVLNDDMIKKLKEIGEAAVPTAVGLMQLKTGADGATIAFNGISSAVGLMSSKLGLGLGALGDTLLKSKADLDAAGSMGIGANNIGMLVRESREAGLSVQQFTDLIKTSQGSLGGLGGVAYRSADTFSKFAAGVQESGKNLQEMGWSQRDIAQATALYMSNSTKLNLNDADSKKQATEAARAYAEQIDSLSKVTGMSRDAIMNSVRAEEKKPANMLAMLQMDENQRQNYKSTQLALASLGPSTQALASEILTGGVRTKEGVAAMAALGPAGTQLEAAIKQQNAAKTKEEKDAAAAAVETAKAAVNQRITSAEYARMVAQATGPVAETMGKLAVENQSLQASMAATNEAHGDAAQAAKNQAEEAKNLQNGRIKDAKTGQYIEDEGQKLSRKMGEANYHAMIQAGGAAKNMEELNGRLGANKAVMDGLDQSIKVLTGSSTSYADAQTKQAGAIKDATNMITGAVSKILPSSKPASSLPANYSENKPIEKPGGRASGSLGMAGKLIEDFGSGTAMILHGREGVVTEAQMKNIIEAAAGMGTASIAPAIASVKNETEKEKTESKPTEQAASTANEEVMKEMLLSLSQLNKSMGQLVSLSEITAENSHKQVKATKGMSGNRLVA